jgi:thiosulfate/3-mercaptopyruvate sulfurtransferase
MRHIGIKLVALLIAAGAGYAQDALVSTEWLAANIGRQDIRLVEVSVNPGVYEQGHIQGAVNFRWHRDLVDPVRRDIVSREAFERLLSQSGIGNDTTVVLYGDTNNWFAAWGAWVFDLYGHAKVQLLDGGRKKWEIERRPLTTAVPTAPRATYRVGTVREALRARLGDVVAAAEGRSNSKIVDIRSKDEYEGRIFAPAGVQELSIRAGHVPGAVNVPWGEAVNQADGTFKSRDELRALYARAGVDGSAPVIVYCRIGERSSHTWFALSRILGYTVRNYDGSWTEYGNAVGVPIVNVAGTVWGGL